MFTLKCWNIAKCENEGEKITLKFFYEKANKIKIKGKTENEDERFHNNNLFDGLVWVSLECVMVYVECRVDDFVISFTHFSHTITESLANLNETQNVWCFFLCLSWYWFVEFSMSLICSFEGRCRFDQRFFSLRFSFGEKYVHFSCRRCLYFEWVLGMLYASQCALLIGWKKRTHMPIACRTHKSIQFHFNAMRIHMFVHSSLFTGWKWNIVHNNNNKKS